MNTDSELYPDICSLKNLFLAWKNVRKGKTKRRYITNRKSNIK